MGLDEVSDGVQSIGGRRGRKRQRCDPSSLWGLSAFWLCLQAPRPGSARTLNLGPQCSGCIQSWSPRQV